MNRFTNGQLATNSELQMANVHVERRHDFSKQSQHIERVLTAPSMVDNSSGMTGNDYIHLRHNAKRAMMEEDRRAAIDHENMILLTKMRNIFSRGTIGSNSGSFKPLEIEPRSLNQEARRRDLERITRDNLGIVHRIRSRKPNYSTADLLSKRRETEKHLRRISKQGQRRADYFTSSVASMSIASQASSRASPLSQSGSAVRPFGGSRPRRLRALEAPFMADGLAAGVSSEVYGVPPPNPPPPQQQHYAGSRSTPDLHGGSAGTLAGGRLTIPELPQYGDQFTASLGAISCDDLRPTPMRLNTAPSNSTRKSASYGGLGAGSYGNSGGAFRAPAPEQLRSGATDDMPSRTCVQMGVSASEPMLALPLPPLGNSLGGKAPAPAPAAALVPPLGAPTPAPGVPAPSPAAGAPGPSVTAAAPAAPSYPAGFVSVDAEAMRTFQMLDADSSGALDLTELGKGMRRVSSDAGVALLQAVDLNRDGLLQPDEWTAHFNHLALTDGRDAALDLLRKLDEAANLLAEAKISVGDDGKVMLSIGFLSDPTKVAAAGPSAPPTSAAAAEGEAPLAMFGGRAVAVTSAAAEQLVEVPTPPVVESPVIARLEADDEANKPDEPLVDVSDSPNPTPGFGGDAGLPTELRRDASSAVLRKALSVQIGYAEGRASLDWTHDHTVQVPRSPTAG